MLPYQLEISYPNESVISGVWSRNHPDLLMNKDSSS